MPVPVLCMSNTILILGDSLSAAYGIQLEQGWASLLQQKLSYHKQIQGQWQVVNASVSGETTAGALARLPDLLNQHQPHLCLIALGANDGLRGMQISHIRDRLNRLVTQCQQNAKVVLVGMQLPPNYGAYAQDFAEAYRQVSTDLKVPLAPFLLEGFADQMQYFQADSLHPTASAQQHILDNLWPMLEDVLIQIEETNKQVSSHK